METETEAWLSQGLVEPKGLAAPEASARPRLPPVSHGSGKAFFLATKFPVTQGNRIFPDQTTRALEPITALPRAKQALWWGSAAQATEQRTGRLFSVVSLQKCGLILED